MARVTDWAALWRELAQVQAGRDRCRGRGGDAWGARADQYQARATRRWARPDSSLEMVASQIAAVPGATLLDIGAGTGAWEVYLAPSVAHITALEPSPAMIAVMRENLAGQQITNVEIVQGAWPDTPVATHDFSLCSHAMYSAQDLPAFVRRMEGVTRRTCFMVFRAPAADGVMAEAARHVRGHPYDSPNFQVGYNVLLEMGVRPDAVFEEAGHWEPWTSATLGDALADVKRRLALDTDEHDAFLLDLLARRLKEQGRELVWPRDMRSALVSWQAGVR